MKSSFCIDLQRFMLIPTKFPLTRFLPTFVYARAEHTQKKENPTEAESSFMLFCSDVTAGVTK